MWRSLIRFTMHLVLGWSLGLAAAKAATLVADRPSPQPAGTTMTFTIDAEGTTNALYRLSVGPAQGLVQPEVVYDGARDNTRTVRVIR